MSDDELDDVDDIDDEDYIPELDEELSRTSRPRRSTSSMKRAYQPVPEFTAHLDLIEVVQEYELLYNVQSPLFNDTLRKDRAWMEIATILNVSESQCKKAWSTLRDGFKRCLKKRQEANGQPVKPWKFDKEMEFLTPFLKTKINSLSETSTEPMMEEVTTSTNNTTKDFDNESADEDDPPEAEDDSNTDENMEEMTKNVKKEKEVDNNEFNSISLDVSDKENNEQEERVVEESEEQEVEESEEQEAEEEDQEETTTQAPKRQRIEPDIERVETPVPKIQPCFIALNKCDLENTMTPRQTRKRQTTTKQTSPKQVTRRLSTVSAASTQNQITPTQTTSSKTRGRKKKIQPQQHVPQATTPSIPSPVTTATPSSTTMLSGLSVSHNDDIDMFFSCIAATVKQFSPLARAMAKSRVFATISEMEMTEIAKKGGK